MIRCMIVEDDIDMLKLLNVILIREKCRPATFTDGAVAATYVDAIDNGQIPAAEFPIFMLTDDMLPGMAGNDLARRVRQSPKIRHIPIVIMSVAPLKYHEELYRADGANVYVIKPFHPKMVLTAIDLAFAPDLPIHYDDRYIALL